MPVITSIKPQKNNKRVNIYLDNEFGFGIDLENFVKFHLKVDQELKKEEIQLIKDAGEQQKILDRILRFVNIRPRSEKEVKDYLNRKRISVLVHGYVFEKLNEFKLINDLEFAKWWVEQRQAFLPKAKRILNNELRIKGIDSEIIKEVLGNIEIDEVKIAKELVEKKKYKWERFDPKIRKQKISLYLSSKGFDWNIISDVIEYEQGAVDYE